LQETALTVLRYQAAAIQTHGWMDNSVLRVVLAALACTDAHMQGNSETQKKKGNSVTPFVAFKNNHSCVSAS